MGLKTGTTTYAMVFDTMCTSVLLLFFAIVCLSLSLNLLLFKAPRLEIFLLQIFLKDASKRQLHISFQNIIEFGKTSVGIT